MRYRILLIVWLLSDIVVFMKAYALAYFLRVGWIFSTDFSVSSYLLTVILVSPIWLLVLATTRTFGLTRSQLTFRNAAYISYSAIVGVALFAITYYFIYGLFFSRLLLVYALIFSAIGTFAWHIIFEKIQRMVLRKDPAEFRALIVGVTRESTRLIELLQTHKNPVTPVAVLDGRGTKETTIHGVKVFGKLNKLEEVLAEQKITHLIQCADLEQSLNLLSACRSKGITYMLLPSVLGIVERDERIESLEGQAVTVVNPAEKKWMWFFR